MKSWNIPEAKVFHYVTDNGSNLVKAVHDAVFRYKLQVDVAACNDLDHDQESGEDYNLDVCFCKDDEDNASEDFG